jgi:cardiolipin synthase
LRYIHLLTLHGLVTAVAVLAYIVTSHAMAQRRNPAAAIAWILFILLVPYLALPAFLAFGTRKLERPASTARPGPPVGRGQSTWAVRTIEALCQPSPAAYHDLELHPDGGAARDALFETIDAAKASIDLCMFIVARDGLGDAVVARLRDKARAGVRVRLLVDGLGRLMKWPPAFAALRHAGAQVAFFAPPLRSPWRGRTNLRNHRKYLVADGALATARLWCGGRNLAEEYFGGRRGAAPWRDLTFGLSGPVIRQASALFERDWAFANGKPADAATAPADPSTPGGAQLVASGPDQADDTVYSVLVASAYQARRRIALSTPYFVPDSALLTALCLAARRGVAVDLLLPARSNHRLSDLARNRALRSLSAAGGRVHLAQGMLHAKLAVIDDAMALAGSVNLDSRSLFLNYELMLAFHHAADVQRFAHWFDAECIPAKTYLATPPGLVRDVAEGMLLWLAFQL